MRENSTVARDFSPPVLIHECPGGGGHLWARINPRWTAENGKTGRSRTDDTRRWCPEHYDERNAQRNEKLSDLAQQRFRIYGELPLPLTKKCLATAPGSHVVGAVLPSRKFYRRKGTKKKDGTHSIQLDSQCKACRREQAEAHRIKLKREDPQEYIRQERERNKVYRKRVRQRRRMLEMERDAQKPSGPFSAWLKAYLKLTGLSPNELCKNTDLDPVIIRRLISDPPQEQVRLSTVDKIGVATGHVSLTVQLYPPDDE